jgi:hypothetical protein
VNVTGYAAQLSKARPWQTSGLRPIACGNERRCNAVDGRAVTHACVPIVDSWHTEE